METKLKFKVGDKVRVMSLEWYNENKNEVGCVLNEDASRFLLKEMSRFCGRTLQIKSIIEDDGYIMCENNFFWQDWMLEDDAVTEGKKKEVEQLNKNNMETKKMTLQEAQEIVKNTKYIVWSEDENMILQKKLFELGCEWTSSGATVEHIESPFIFVEDDLKLKYAEKENYKKFENSSNQYLTLKQIISIEIEQPKEEPEPKFDPKTLQPFDEVLVREDGFMWLARFFDYYDGVYNVTNGNSWSYCIPYNDDTKHLHGTCDEAPEFYRLD